MVTDLKSLVDTDRGLVSRRIFVDPLYRTRLETEQDLYVGRRQDVLRNTDGSWKIARRTIVLDQNVLLAKNLRNFF